MPSVLPVLLCSLAALAFWGSIGFALSRRLAPAPLALPIAPALGWAVHSALALPLFRMVGFTPWTVWFSTVLVFAAAITVLRSPAPTDRDDAAFRIPLWAYGVAALLAVVPAMALFPKFSGDAVAFAGPIFDHSKVAIVDEMTRLGVPPGNPFFGEAGHEAPLAYYYLWHFSAAELALAFHVSGWEADIALSGFTAFFSLTLMMGFAAWLGGRAAAGIWVVPLAFAASLHPIFEAVFGVENFYTLLLPPSGFAGWLFQTTWAPQHIASTSCVLLAGFLLVKLARQPSSLAAAVLALVVVVGFESSTWVGGILFAAASPLLTLVLLADAPAGTHMRFLVFAIGAAIVAAMLAYPFLHDELLNAVGRNVAAPIAFDPYAVFSIGIPDRWRRVVDLPGYWLVLLVIEFPAIYLPGSFSLFGTLRSKFVAGAALTTVKVFACLTLVSLLIPAYFTITFADNNDLGWRAVLPGVFILTIFAATGLSRWLARPAPFAATATLLLLLLALPRSFELTAKNLNGEASSSGRAFAATPAMWAAVRRHTAPAERVANNPLFLADMTPWPVNLSWALFADRRSCFAGSDLALPYTALPRARLAKIDDQFQRVFDGRGDANDVRDLAERYQCRTVVLTAEDGAWHNDPFAASGLYRMVEQKAGAWKIYRAVAAPAQSKPAPH